MRKPSPSFYISRALRYSLIIAIACITLVACQQARQSPITSTNDNVGNNFIPLYKPEANFVVANSLSVQSLSDEELKNTKVGYTRTFSNGKSIDYVVIDDLVVDGDIILTSVDEFEASLDEYEKVLKSQGNSELATQGAMTPQICNFGFWGWCASWATGRAWPNGIVNYETPTTAQGFANYEINNIMTAINTLSNNTDITMRASTNGNRIRFNGNGSSCSSNLGMTGGVQIVYLANGCADSMGDVMHEIGHALGLMHEHQRPDRDSFVRPNYSNLKDIEWWRFSWKGPAQSNIVNKEGSMENETPYDYYSIMHYPLISNNTSWAKNTGLNIINVTGTAANQLDSFGNPPKYSGLPSCIAAVGQRCALTPRDIQAINSRY